MMLNVVIILHLFLIYIYSNKTSFLPTFHFLGQLKVEAIMHYLVDSR